jgi:hydrogenase maturation protein HypF
MAEKAAVKRRAYATVSGVVQGVGFRPFVAGAARRCGLYGFVRNDSGVVYIEAEGSEADIERFLEEVKNSPPRGSFIEKIEINWAEALKDTPESHGFSIHESGEGSGGTVMPSPDISVCEDCLRELEEPENPRYRNPFVSCTLCGPRFSIMRRLPYDRENTSMGQFPLCELCKSQYEDAGDRRCHAQTVCCNNCGPELSYLSAETGFGVDVTLAGEAALMAAADALKNGEVIAVKGIGGFHFACSPFREDTVRRLRDLKGREEEPFAVMFPSLDEIKKNCLVSREEEELLTSREKPIVLLERTETDMAKGVYGSSRYMGSFLPYTPLQHLLLKETGPLVMTSANVSGLPIIKDDDEMLAFHNRILPQRPLGGILTNNRGIVRRLDDSVTAAVLGETQFFRRARGYVPLPITIPVPPEQAGSRAVIACGPQQKNTISLSARQYIYPSTEVGDLDRLETREVYRETVDDMKGMLNIRPELAVCDLHPGYYATQAAHASGLPVLPVQHHYAHIASVMAEAGLTESVIGVAFDGTGYGTDGTVWGGEFLIASPKEFRRAGCLKPVRLFGSDESAYTSVLFIFIGLILSYAFRFEIPVP